MTTALPRDERRKRTETAILDAARELFAETGFERTTIRGVAALAGIDPALVMQYYGNKERLFAEAARWNEQDPGFAEASIEQLPAIAVADMFEHFEHALDGEAAKALLRNCLTHPSALASMKDEVMCDVAAMVAAKVEAPDAELRAALFTACMMGLAMGRYLIELPDLATASQAEVERLLVPALSALLEPPPA